MKTTPKVSEGLAAFPARGGKISSCAYSLCLKNKRCPETQISEAEQLSPLPCRARSQTPGPSLSPPCNVLPGWGQRGTPLLALKPSTRSFLARAVPKGWKCENTFSAESKELRFWGRFVDLMLPTLSLFKAALL